MHALRHFAVLHQNPLSSSFISTDSKEYEAPYPDTIMACASDSLVKVLHLHC